MIQQPLGDEEPREPIFRDPDKPYAGLGRQSLRTMARNALSEEEWRRKVRRANWKPTWTKWPRRWPAKPST